jgi:hypothetical protein
MRVVTATASDRQSPVALEARAFVEGDRLIAEVLASEPVRVWGAIAGDDGHSVDLSERVVPSVHHRLESRQALRPAQGYSVVLYGEDLAGNAMAPWVTRVEAPPAAQVSITEVVASPLRDWSDSAPAGWPFDETPGGGAVSESDEWVELVHWGEGPISLIDSGLVVRALDGTPSETRLSEAASLYFGAGGHVGEWWPGEGLVARLRGTMSQTDLVLEVWSGSRRLDRLAIGALEGAEHPGGAPPSLEYEAIARDPAGFWRWCAPTPGDATPSSDCLP